MLCTNSVALLGSLTGRMVLNFRIPKNFPPYDAKENDLIITWDIFMQDFRSIPLEAIFVVGAYPVKTPKQIEIFWQYFDKAVRPMTSSQKTRFMKTLKN